MPPKECSRQRYDRVEATKTLSITRSMSRLPNERPLHPSMRDGRCEIQCERIAQEAEEAHVARKHVSETNCALHGIILVVLWACTGRIGDRRTGVAAFGGLMSATRTRALLLLSAIILLCNTSTAARAVPSGERRLVHRLCSTAGSSRSQQPTFRQQRPC